MGEDPQSPNSEPNGERRGKKAPPPFLFPPALLLEPVSTRRQRCRCDYWRSLPGDGTLAGRLSILERAAEFLRWLRDVSEQSALWESTMIRLRFRPRKRTLGRIGLATRNFSSGMFDAGNVRDKSTSSPRICSANC